MCCVNKLAKKILHCKKKSDDTSRALREKGWCATITAVRDNKRKDMKNIQSTIKSVRG